MYTDLDKKEDVKILHGRGYAQELDRRMGRFSNFFRRLFRRKVSLSPHAYRLRFGSFRRALASAY
jgi:hypothetical protein